MWGHSKLNDEDLKEAVTAPHAMGDDDVGHSNASDYTHGNSSQRRWFRRGFDAGDLRRCDTFAVSKCPEL